MNNPYKEFFKSIGDALTKLSNMVIWVAEHTMSVKDYKEFIDKFAEKPELYYADGRRQNEN